MKDITLEVQKKIGCSAREAFNKLKEMGAVKKGIWHVVEFEGKTIKFKMESIPFHGLPKRYCPKKLKIVSE